MLTSMAICLPISYGLYAIGSMSLRHSISLVTSLTCFMLILVLVAIAARRALLPRPRALERAPEEERNYYLSLRERITTAVLAIFLVMVTLLAIAILALVL